MTFDKKFIEYYSTFLLLFEYFGTKKHMPVNDVYSNKIIIESNCGKRIPREAYVIHTLPVIMVIVT